MGIIDDDKLQSILPKYNELKLSELAKFLTNLGYKPVINLETAEKLVQELNYDEELIMNYTKQGLRRILQDRSKCLG